MEYARITLRIPEALHQQLSEQAKITSKSLNAEIIARLNSSFDAAKSTLPRIDQGEDTVRIYSNGSTYRDLEMICEDIRHDSPISALFAVRDGKYNKSALTLVLYTEEKACVYDQTLLTAERGAREAEIWEICNALDSFNVFKNTKFITERVEQTQEIEPDNALALLESKPSKPINKDTLCQFLSMFGNTEGKIYPRDMFLDYWDRLF